MRFLVSYMLMVVAWLLLSCNPAKLSDARGEYLRGAYHAAGETYRKLYRHVPREERAQRAVIAFEMGETLRRLNQSARAVTAYSNAIRYGYPDTIVYLHYARMLHREGDYMAAAEAYRRFLVFRPDNPLGLNGLRGVELAGEWSGDPPPYRIERMTLFNSNRGEFSPMLSPEGDRLYFTSSREEALGEERSPVTGMKYNDLFRSVKNVHGAWQQPERIESGINTVHDEGTPSLSPDGEWIYYTFSAADPDRPTATQVYLSRWVDGRWSDGRPLEIVKDDSLSLFAHPAISPSGRYLYFVSDMPGGYGGKDIWRGRIRGNDELLFVENPGPGINTAGDELFPYLRNDTTLYFSSDGHPGLGGLDLFRAVGVVEPDDASRREGSLPTAAEETEGWSVRNLRSPLNSPADDFGITFGPEGENGFFSSNRDDVRGYDHLYSFTYPGSTAWIEGFAVDQEDEFIRGAVVAVVGSDGAQRRFVTGKEGEYRFRAERGTTYLMMASADGFLNQRHSISTSPAETDTLYYVDFEMIPYHKPVVLEHIFYDFDRAALRAESKEELDALIDLLNEHPSVAIALAAHTDRKGSDEYNLDLSLRRAQSVVHYMVAHGIDARRLSARGHGKDRPVRVTKRIAQQIGFLREGELLTGDFIETLPPDQQEIADQLNRRTSFEVTDREFGLH